MAHVCMAWCRTNRPTCMRGTLRSRRIGMEQWGYVYQIEYVWPMGAMHKGGERRKGRTAPPRFLCERTTTTQSNLVSKVFVIFLGSEYIYRESAQNQPPTRYTQREERKKQHRKNFCAALSPSLLVIFFLGFVRTLVAGFFSWFMLQAPRRALPRL